MTNINVFKNKIVKKGVFDINKIYKECKDWFSDSKYEYTEVDKTTKTKDRGFEILYKVFGKRDLTDYFQLRIEVDFLFEQTKEVQIDNKKMFKGNVEMRMSAILITDWQKKWQKTKFSKFLQKVYEKHLIKKKIDSVYGGKCYLEGMDFFQNMKKAFELHTF